VADDGFNNSRWWRQAADRPSSPDRQFNKYDNHPAGKVSYKEAVAFCIWLTDKLSYEVRLPTEWEWQQAATAGDPTNAYPWGPWDAARANTQESELQRATAVGMYPHGVSPLVGVFDMSGNVWEWCLNEHVNPRRVEVSGEEDRAVRGGSCNFDRGFAQCSSRAKNPPGYRFDDVGFRVVCASPIF
jgi:formylglycine-generating enzyme required for sulfatase activity